MSDLIDTVWGLPVPVLATIFAVTLAILVLGFVAWSVRTGGRVEKCPVCRMKSVYFTDNESVCARKHWWDLNGKELK